MANSRTKRTSQRFSRIKEDVIERDGSLCCYCDIVLIPETITLDHIVPDSKMGNYNTTNLTPACGACNRKRGNADFFEYILPFNWPPEKIKKYRQLYFGNLKIKILNIAKEKYMVEKIIIPVIAIKSACKKLKIKRIDFSSYEERYFFQIKFEERCERKVARSCFEQLIRIIEIESADF